MDREVAIQKLKQIKGKDLHDLAHQYGITVSKNGKQNKGWAGATLEKYLGLLPNTRQEPNFGTWELKTIPLKYGRDGVLKPKETMAITMINATDIREQTFSNSHLLIKLRRMVIVSRIVGDNYLQLSKVHDVVKFNLSDEAYTVIERDYELVRNAILDPAKGFGTLTGKMGQYVQPRTKGAGHGSTTRAFYARIPFLSICIKL